MKKEPMVITDAHQLPLIMSREQLAQLAGVDPRTVYTWLRDGKVPGSYKQGGKWLINRDEVLAAWSGKRIPRKRKIQQVAEIDGVAV